MIRKLLEYISSKKDTKNSDNKPIIKKDFKTGYDYLEFMCKNVRNRTTGYRSNVEPMTDRVTFICDCLNKLGITYQLIPFTYDKCDDPDYVGYGENKLVNVQVFFPATDKDTKKTIIFLAHHDVSNTKSENCQDNSASVCNLIHLCSELKNMQFRTISSYIIFTDCEEIGGRGSRKLCSQLSNKEFGDIELEGIVGLELTSNGTEFWVDQAEDMNITQKLMNVWHKETYEFPTPYNECMTIRRSGFDAICVGILPIEDVECLEKGNRCGNWSLCHSDYDTFDSAVEEDMTNLVMFLKKLVNET